MESTHLQYIHIGEACICSGCLQRGRGAREMEWRDGGVEEAGLEGVWQRWDGIIIYIAVFCSS